MAAVLEEEHALWDALDFVWSPSALVAVRATSLNPASSSAAPLPDATSASNAGCKARLSVSPATASQLVAAKRPVAEKLAGAAAASRTSPASCQVPGCAGGLNVAYSKRTRCVIMRLCVPLCYARSVGGCGGHASLFTLLLARSRQAVRRARARG